MYLAGGWLDQARVLVQSSAARPICTIRLKLAAANAAVARAKTGLNPGSVDGYRVDSGGPAGDDLDGMLYSCRDLKAGGGALA